MTRGFHLLATDGEIGHVDDFLVNEDWTLRYLVVDTSNWLGGKWVLISTTVLDEIDSPGKRIGVKLTLDEISRSPTVDTANIETHRNAPLDHHLVIAAARCPAQRIET